MNIHASTWNVASINPNWPRRATRIAKVIPRETTILCTQENGPSKRAVKLWYAIQELHGKHWLRVARGSGQNVYYDSRVWKLEEAHLVKLGHAKAALLTNFTHKGTNTPLTVVSAHLSPYSTAARRKVRQKQIRVLEKAVLKFAGSRPVLFSGDFNDGDKGVHEYLMRSVAGWDYAAPANRRKTIVPGNPGVPIDRHYTRDITVTKTRIDTTTSKDHSEHLRVRLVAHTRKARDEETD